MTTFLDLIQNNDFRDFVRKRIASFAGESYTFPNVLPKLYKYRPLSSYAINDIINGRITLSSIGEFNDIFDGALHQYGTKEEMAKAAEVKWQEWESHRIAAHLPEGLLQHDNMVNTYIKQFKVESRLKFRELDYLGTFACCFSKDNASPLMWAHYADSNKGICIEYEFDKLPQGNLFRDSLFPVAYTSIPVCLSDLIEDKQNKIYQYPLDAAVLCAALNKAAVWKYEQEWRIIWVLVSANENRRRLSIDAHIRPSKVYLGYHFLKPFFYYDYKDKAESEKCEERITYFFKLIAFLQTNNVPISIMMPAIGSYHFKAYDIPIDDLYSFMRKNFEYNRPESIRYYYTVHDDLMDLVEKTREANHA